MVQRIGGFRRKTRGKLSKKVGDKGRIVISRFLQSFEKSDKVNLTIEPAYQKGMYHPRFHGKSGVIKSKEGNCYLVEIKDGRPYGQVDLEGESIYKWYLVGFWSDLNGKYDSWSVKLSYKDFWIIRSSSEFTFNKALLST